MHAHLYGGVIPAVLLILVTTDLIFQLLFGIFLLSVFIAIIRAIAKKPEITDHWYHLFEEGQFSSQEFYKTTVETLKKMEIPHIYFERTNKREGGILNDKREYIVVYRGSLSYILCAAPFGTAFFISWRQGQTRGFAQRMLAGIPVFGKALEQIFCKRTYYHEDTELMFRDTVHSTVLKIVDAMALAKGIRGLTELERKPIMAKR